MLGRAELARRAGEQHLAVGEHEQLARIAFGLGDVVGREDDARAGGDARVDELPEPRALARIERRRRLVEQQHRGVGDQADRDVDALAVAAGEAADLIAGALAQTGLLEHPSTAASASATPSRRANSRRFSATDSFE